MVFPGTGRLGTKPLAGRLRRYWMQPGIPPAGSDRPSAPGSEANLRESRSRAAPELPRPAKEETDQEESQRIVKKESPRHYDADRRGRLASPRSHFDAAPVRVLS